MQLRHEHLNRIHEIRDRVNAATPGLWKRGRGTKYVSVVSVREGYEEYICGKIQSFKDTPDIQINGESNGEFIIHSREDIPYLLDLIDELIEAKFNGMAESEMNKP